MTSILSGVTNTSALSARNAYNRQVNSYNDANMRLSSGSNFTSPARGGAAAAIAANISKEISVLSTVSNTVSNASALVNLAYGALNEQADLLVDMQALAASSQNGALSSSARQKLQDEFNALLTEVNNLSQTTRWNGQSILSGGAAAITSPGAVTAAQNGPNGATVPANTFDTGAAVDVTGFVNGAAEAVSVSAAGNNSYDIGVKVGGQWFTAKGTVPTAGEDVILSGSTDSFSTITLTYAAGIAGLNNETNFETALTQYFGLDNTNITASFQAVSADIAGQPIDANSLATLGSTQPGVYAIRYDGANDTTSTTVNGTFTLTDGKNTYTAEVTADGAQTISFDNGISFQMTAGFTSNTAVPQVLLDVTPNNETSFNFQVGPTSNDTSTITIPGSSSAALNIGGLSISSVGNAQTASTSIDSALESVSAAIATLGAQQRGLEANLSNLSTMIEGFESARSLYADADITQATIDRSLASVMQNMAIYALTETLNNTSQSLMTLMNSVRS